MSAHLDKVTVCVCTFRRNTLLNRLLQRLELQRTGDAFTFDIVVADNDAGCGAKELVREFAANSAVPIIYTSEPEQNIALARNRAVARADGNFIAFIDDDEFPESDWLSVMRSTCESYDAAGVLGPVRPHFEQPPARWILEGGFFERPENPTGRILHWRECRTGNVLFRRAILRDVAEPFRPEFGTGGEDVDFFHRMVEAGHVFRWCAEGAVHETVPQERCTRSYLLKRALLRGQNNNKLAAGKAGRLARSFVAIPSYLAMLPFTLIFGEHVFMKYFIRLCDHTGRVLAFFGINPVSQR